MGKPPELMTVAQAAAELDLTPRRVRQLITGTDREPAILPAEKYGRDYLIRRSDLSKVPRGRKPGRPRSAANPRKGHK